MIFGLVSVGQMQGEAGGAKVVGDRGLDGVVDAILFIAILGFSAIALLAFALAAPLAIALTAGLGAWSAATARRGTRRFWRTAGPAQV